MPIVWYRESSSTVSVKRRHLPTVSMSAEWQHSHLYEAHGKGAWGEGGGGEGGGRGWTGQVKWQSVRKSKADDVSSSEQRKRVERERSSPRACSGPRWRCPTCIGGAASSCARRSSPSWSSTFTAAAAPGAGSRIALASRERPHQRRRDRHGTGASDKAAAVAPPRSH